MYRLDSEPLQYLHSTVFPLAMLSFHFWHRHHIYYNYVNKSVFLKNSYFSLRYPETRFQSFLIYPYEVIFDILYMCKGELYFTSEPKWLVHTRCFEGVGGREWSTRDVLSPVHRAPPHARLLRQRKIPRPDKLCDLPALPQIELLPQEVPSSILKLSAKATLLTYWSF